MKLTCIGRLPKSESRIGSFTGVFAFYLDRELRRLGVELQWALNNEAVKDLPRADHILAFGNRWFSVFGGAEEMHDHTDGCVTQIAENPRHDVGVNTTFIINSVDDARCTHIGWAAEPSLFYPEPHPYILLDHPAYNVSMLTQMDDLLVQARRYRGKYKVYRLLGDGLHPVVHNVDDFERSSAVPYPEMAAIMRRCAVYVVTHRESCGLQTLEAAMSGAAVVAPKGFMNPNLSDELPFIEFDGKVPWKEAEALHETGRCRDSVLHFQWSRPAIRIVEYFARKAR